MKKSPNYLFLLADDQGAWAMGCAGNSDIHTPSLDRLAAEGIRFDNFFCASPVCSPARASILTGAMPSCHGVLDWLDGGNLDRSLPELQGHSGYEHETVPISYTSHLTAYTDLLAEHGYRCGLSGKWHLGDSLHPTHGFTDWYTIGRGGCGYFEPDIIYDGKIHFETGYVTDKIADRGIAFLEQYAAQDQPLYLSLHFTAPHSPWEESDHPKEYLDLYRNCSFSSTPDLPLHPQQVHTCPHGTGERRKELLRGYYASITAMDHQIGRVIQRLEDLGLREDTIIIFTSDNGMNMGHHGIWGKGNGTFPQNMFDSSIKVPFLISRKGHCREGAVCSELFSHYDILPTIAQLSGIPLKTRQELPGRSFLPWLLNPAKEEEEPIVIFDEYGPVRMIRNQEWKLVLRYPYGPDEFFHLTQDPEETRNLIEDPSCQSHILKMRAELESWFLRYSDPDLDGRKEPVTGTGQYCRPGSGAHLLKKFGPKPEFSIPGRS